jgi:hypothetical protein
MILAATAGSDGWNRGSNFPLLDREVTHYLVREQLPRRPEVSPPLRRCDPQLLEERLDVAVLRQQQASSPRIEPRRMR